MRGGMRMGGAMLLALASGLASASVAASSTATAVQGLGNVLPLRERPARPPRGKGKARRHGAKLRPNRLHMSRRAKRRHRRARRGH